MNFTSVTSKRLFSSLLLSFSLGAMVLAATQEKSQPEKRWVRLQVIEVARKPLADSILAQVQQGTSFQKLARKHSLHASAKEGGEIGWAALDSVDSDSKTVMASLPIGRTSTILQKGKRFFIYYKLNELMESDYLKLNGHMSDAFLSVRQMAPSSIPLIPSILSNVKLQEFGYRGDAYLGLGKYPRAMAYYDSALVLAREIGDHSSEAHHLNNLGNVYHSLAQYRQAIAYYDSALILAQILGDRSSEGRHLGNLGGAHRSLAQYTQAIAYYDSALAIAREFGDRSGEGRRLGNLAIVYGSLGQYPRAIAYFDSALVIAREMGNRNEEGIWLGNLGIVHSSLGQYHQAIAYANSALSIANDIETMEGIWHWCWSLAKSHAKMPESKNYEVINFYHSAISALENITAQLVKDVHKLSFLEDKQKLYADYISYLMVQPESQHHEKALEISEASRTRALKDLLQGQRIQTPFTVEKRIAATKRTEELFASHATGQIGPSSVSDLTRAGAEERLDDWAKQISIPPDTLGSTEGAPSIRMREIQAEARSATLLEYHVLDSCIAIWVINETGKVFGFKQNMPKAKLEALIDSARKALGVESLTFRNVKPVSTSKKSQAAQYRTVFQTLDSLLIQPVARYLPKDSSRQLMILPHDILFLLPFACLMNNNGQYLTQRYTFSTAPSIGLLKFTRGRIREQQDREKPKLLLMGNPKMPDPEMWSQLLGAEQEVKLIAKLVNQKKGAGFQAPGALPLQALPLTNAQATEAEFREIVSIQNYLHLATHGYVVSDALRCGLILAKTGTTMETDGILTTAEIFGLPLNAELVVLSACQTGLGQISSDGVAGLSRAFLYAGAASLIVSLWQVPDAATQHLMVKFYEELACDGNKARALQAAQLHTMKTYPHPRDWAAFVLVGQPK